MFGVYRVLSAVGMLLAALDIQPPKEAFVQDERIDRVDGELKRSEEHTSELQSLMRISYAVFCLKKKKTHNHKPQAHRSNIHQNQTLTTHTCIMLIPMIRHGHTYTTLLPIHLS